MESKYPNCNCGACPLNKYKPVVPQQGTTGLLIIGQCPGREEILAGKPFAGVSGKILAEAVDNLNYATITNAVLCPLPADMKEVPLAAINCCNGHIRNLKAHALKTIVFGEVALQACEEPYAFKTVNGRSLNNDTLYVTYHPGYIARQGGKLKSWKNGINRFLHPEEQENLKLDYPIHTDNEMWRPQSSIVAFDVETSGRWHSPGFRLLMLQLFDGNSISVYTEKFIIDNAKLIQFLMERPLITYVAHNGKFDQHALLNVGVEARLDFDTMLAHYTLHESGERHGLKELGHKYFGLDDWQKPMLNKYGVKDESIDFAKIPSDVLAKYGAIDVIVTWALYLKLHTELTKDDLYWKPFMVPLMEGSETLLHMERRGLAVDTDWLADVKQIIESLAKEQEREVKKRGGIPIFNIRSTQQVGSLLFDELGLQEPKIYGLPPRSTNIQALDEMEPQDSTGTITALKAFRHFDKMATTYLPALQDNTCVDGRIHASFNLHRVETGRLSSSEPNLQNIPSPKSDSDIAGALIRSCFIPAPGFVFVEADYSQNEIRVGAAISGDKFLLDVYNNGGDLHTEVAKAIFHTDNPTKAQRSLAKKFNFGYMYGANASVIAKNAGMNVADVIPVFNEYKRLLSGFEAWKLKQWELAQRQGYVSTVFGRRRRFPIITRANMDECRKASVNMPIQSSGSDLTLVAAGIVDERYRLANIVHDSILVECPSDEAMFIGEDIAKIMCQVGSKYFPNVKWKADFEVKERWHPKPEASLYSKVL